VTSDARSHPHGTVPAWLRQTGGEERLFVALAVFAAIVLQGLLPSRYGIRPRALIPALEFALLLGLFAINPRRINRQHPGLRAASLLLTALISAANAVSAALLINSILHPSRHSPSAAALLSTGASIYLTNIIAFGLWFWEFDRGGPAARTYAVRRFPDFLFPQMINPELTHPDWEPNFVDYLYVSFTNATAFSPTDTMPLSRWAKMLMLVQSAIAVATVALVIARAVNILHA
jgi:hypothetical protein